MKATMPHLRMRTLLLLPLLLIPAALTTASLLIVRRHMQQELRQSLAEDLLHSTATFRNLEKSRRAMLARDAILIADQSTLKALMTTQDAATIQNAGGEFARLSGSDLFALASPTGGVIATYLGGQGATPAGIESPISAWLGNPGGSPYIEVHGRLFEIAAQPIYFGSSKNGSVLGYLVVGSAIDRSLAEQVAQSVSGEVAFYANHRIAGSTLSPEGEMALARALATEGDASEVAIGGGRYRLERIALVPGGAGAVEMILLKSMQALRSEESGLNRMTIVLGAVALVVGGLLALWVARLLTGPLEALAVGVRALGEGRPDVQLPATGAEEVRELSLAVDAMRRQIRKAQADLVEAERLATIGKMASSVSHDVRHYLSSVYANAEFLASRELSADDKLELLRDIQLSVQGTTDLIDSLLLFSRTGLSLNKSYESVAYLAERAIALVRNHPETTGIEISFTANGSCETLVDAKKIERVIYNLTLNACQAAGQNGVPKVVEVIAAETCDSVLVDVIDSGAGVAEEIRGSLFEPFISANKENGVGIGLTLASTIALEHGGDVRLKETEPGRTVFRLKLPRTVVA